MKRKTYTTFAAIHLGSEALGMDIVEYRGLKGLKVIERCHRHIRLGEETFKNKIIPFSMVNEICEILIGFKELMQADGVEEYALQATTAIREARNQTSLLDQIKTKTGLDVEVVDMPWEIYTKYVAIRQTMREQQINVDRDGVLMVDISSGGLGITYVQDDQIRYQENLRLGIIRIKESFSRIQRNSSKFNRALVQFLSSNLGPVRQAMEAKPARYLVLSGPETEIVLQLLGRPTGLKVQRVTAQEFRDLAQKVDQLNLSQIIKVYDLPEEAAELVLPTLIFYEQMLDLVPAQEVVFLPDRFIDGMTLLHIGMNKDRDFRKLLENEKLSILHHFGTLYKYDSKHALQVERLATIIFDKLGKRHGLDGHCRILLKGAALLHDIGKFVSMRHHSLYSYQLIMATDLLGFSERDKKIIAYASYYHARNIFGEGDRGEVPAPEMELKAIVAKIAAILCLADALDRSYLQKIQTCQVSTKGEEVIIGVTSKQDLALEEWTFADKASMFEEIFGLKVHMERVSEHG